MTTKTYEQERQEIIDLLNTAINVTEDAPSLEDMSSVDTALERLKVFMPVVEMDITSKIDQLEKSLISFDEMYFNVANIIKQLDLHRPKNSQEEQVEYLAYKLYIVIFQKATMLYAQKRHRKDHMDTFMMKVVTRLEVIRISNSFITN